MGFWNKLGKIALTAAPYVAAPFTGGASLLATGAANKAVQKWSESDAKKNIAKGLAPSKFDAALGKVGGIAGMASSFINPGNALMNLGTKGSILAKIGTGALSGSDGGWKGALLGGATGALGGKGIGPSGSVLNKVSKTAGTILGGMGKGGATGNDYPYRTPPYAPEKGEGGWEEGVGSILASLGKARGRTQDDEDSPSSSSTPMGRGASDMNTTRRAPNNQSIGSTLGDRDELRRYTGISGGKHPITPSAMGNPDLYTSIRAGSRDAVRDQGFRKGYEINTNTEQLDESGNPIITNSRMGPITASYAKYARQQNPRRQANAR